MINTLRKAMVCLILSSFVLTAEAEPGRIETSDGVELFYEVRGEGIPCLYIHGGPGAGSYWLQKFSGEMLERRFRMIYLDQRGSCRSATPSNGDYSLDRLVRDLEEVRASLGIREWLTLGHSFGGVLQVVYAKQHPEVIRGMMMLNCSLSLQDSAQEALPKACELLGSAAPAECSDASIPLPVRIPKIYGELRKRDLWWKMGYGSYKSIDLMNATSFEEVPNFNHAFENSPIPEEYLGDFRETAPQLSMPVLFFYGRTDWMVGPNHHKSIKFPSMLSWGSYAGHVPSIEAASDLEKAIDAYREKFGFLPTGSK